MQKKFLPLTLGGLGIGITEFVMMGLLPDIAKDLSISIPKAGYLISAYALGVVIGAPLLIMIAGKYPPKKILLALMVMFTVFNAFSAFAPTFTTLFIARLLSGLPHGAFFGVGSVVASRIAEKGKAAQAVSLMFMGLTIANIVGVPLGTFIGHNFSWRISFAVVVFVGLVTLLSLKLWLPALEAAKNRDLKSELGFFKKREAWIIIFMISIGTGGLFTWYSYIAPLMTEVAGFSANNVTYILMLAGVGMMVGNFIGGILADKFSPAKASAALLIVMVITLTIVHFVSDNQVLALIMTFITGAVAFSLAAPIQMLMIQSAKGSEMLAASASQASFNIGNALGAFFGGLPLAYGFDYTSPAYVGAAMALVGSFFAFWLIRNNRSTPGETVEEEREEKFVMMH
ncbi:MFS transporter [Pedobacter rhizosphaerae]|uniref:MFS transporter, DHA1 family, arabinose polymer transporter n=1 Tax=Pedobacter rhizosphaerae TaxID=390241 RepID=A0A1H9NLQ8_9SPHI|nr:MFS transporter [Pedobacter rhizosphaerae]SER36878.1 MFS transporter, DHA1 family, arabinose polymer transporter [Pedobacter rhizosphaerae]